VASKKQHYRLMTSIDLTGTQFTPLGGASSGFGGVFDGRGQTLRNPNFYEQGGGSVGPNLTDDYWIHGPEPMDQYRVVMDGVTAKGMAAWGNQLGPTRVESVVAYLQTLRGQNVPGGKAPEGEYFDPEAAAAEDAAEEAPEEAAEEAAEEAETP
jgi:hypothetical protein